MRSRIPMETGLKAVVACIFCLHLNGCQSSSEKMKTADNEVPRHKNWWNYYELGKAHLNESSYELAIKNFQRCIGLLPGARLTNDQPAWRVRTYGMHFAENYFPHRELGVTYFLMGKNQQAIEALQQSIERVPSARASHYLNQAQAKIVNVKPRFPMKIEFNGARRLLTHKHTRTLQGKVFGGGLVSDVVVAGRTVPVENASEVVTFSETFPLEPGKNVFHVTGRDLQGQKITRSVEMTADWEAPGIYIESVSVVNGQYHISGYCEDNIALSFVSLNNTVHFTGDEHTATPRYSFEWSIKQDRMAQLTLKDLAGNAWNIELQAEVQRFLQRDEQMAQYVALAKDVGGLKRAPDRKAPSIRWSHGVYEQKTFQPTVFIDVSIQDAGGIQRIELNGQSRLADNQKGLRSIRLGQFVRASEGTNVLKMAVWDQEGNRAESRFTVVKETPEYLWNKHRLRASVLPVITPARDWTGDDFRLLMEYHFQNKVKPFAPRFFLMPVDRTVWNELLIQQKLSLSELADPRARLAVPSYEVLDVLIKVQSFMDHGGYTLRGSAISASTGSILFSDDVYSESAGGNKERMVEGLVSKIESRFPYAKAKLLSAKKGKLKFELDTPSKIEFGHKFLVIDSQGQSLEEGRLKKWENRRVEVAVLGRKGKVCDGRILEGKAFPLLNDGDRLYTR